MFTKIIIFCVILFEVTIVNAVECDFESKCDWHIPSNWERVEAQKSQGPKTDGTLDMASGHYLIMRWPKTKGILTSPTSLMGGSFCLSFNTALQGHVSLNIVTENWFWMDKTVRKFNKTSTSWKSETIDINVGPDSSVIIEATISKKNGWVAIDDINLSRGECKDRNKTSNKIWGGLLDAFENELENWFNPSSTTTKTSVKATTSTTIRVTKKPTENPTTKTITKSTEKLTTPVKSTKSSTVKTTKKATERPIVITTKTTTGRPTVKTTVKVTERSTVKTTVKVTERSTVKTTEKVTERPTKTTTEKVTERSTKTTTKKSTPTITRSTIKTSKKSTETTTAKIVTPKQENTTKKSTELPKNETSSTRIVDHGNESSTQQITTTDGHSVSKDSSSQYSSTPLVLTTLKETSNTANSTLNSNTTDENLNITSSSYEFVTENTTQFETTDNVTKLTSEENENTTFPNSTLSQNETITNGTYETKNSTAKVTVIFVTPTKNPQINSTDAIEGVKDDVKDSASTAEKKLTVKYWLIISGGTVLVLMVVAMFASYFVKKRKEQMLVMSNISPNYQVNSADPSLQTNPSYSYDMDSSDNFTFKRDDKQNLIKNSDDFVC